MKKRLPVLIAASVLIPVIVSGQPGYPFGGDLSALLFSSEQNEDRSFLGVYLDDVTAEIATELNLPGEYGALLMRVMDDTPAAAAGLEHRDVITHWNGQRVEGAKQLQRMVAETPAGRKINVRLFRQGTKTEKEVTIRRFRDTSHHDPEPRNHHFHNWFPPSTEDPPRDIATRDGPRLGVQLQPLTDQLGAYFGLGKDHAGILVSGIVEDSAAQNADMRAGDVITAIEGESVQSADDIRHALQGKADNITIDIIRNREAIPITVHLETPEKPEKPEKPEEETSIPYPKEAM